MILCCGEALIDMIGRDIGDGEQAFVPHAGGAIFNTSIALGRLGIDVGLLSGVSRDLFGVKITDNLAQSNVDQTHLIRSDRPTTLAFVQLANGQANYTFFDENSAGRMLYASDTPSLSKSVDTLYFGGISLASEPCGDAYLALAEQSAEHNVVMLDPNIRASFIADEKRYRSRLEKMISLADIVKVSDEDLDWIFPKAVSLDEKLAWVKSQGPSIVILTKGADGAVAYFGQDQQVNTPAVKADVVDTVGAGDTFNAGFLAKLSEFQVLNKTKLKQIDSDNLATALGFAAKVASIVVSRSGANPPWSNEL